MPESRNVQERLDAVLDWVRGIGEGVAFPDWAEHSQDKSDREAARRFCRDLIAELEGRPNIEIGDVIRFAYADGSIGGLRVSGFDHSSDGNLVVTGEMLR